MRSTHVLTIGFTAALLATGCSNNSDAIKLPVQPTAVETTAAPTTIASTTPSPSSTTPPTIPALTVAETTAAPTTAPPSTLDPESQIRADLQRATQVFVDCQITPETCDFAAYAIPGSPSDTHIRGVVSDLLEQNRRARAGVGGVERFINSIRVNGRAASVEVCDQDTLIMVDAQDLANPNDDIVFNDDVGTRLQTVTLRATRDGWRLHTVAGHSVHVGELTCAS